MKAVNFLFFLVFLAVFEGIAFVVYSIEPTFGFLGGPAAFIAAWLLATAIKIVDEWEQIIILRFGKFSTVKKAGIRLVVPVIDRAIFVDTRVLTMDIPKQQAITKDNVPVLINGVVYFKVVNPQDAITKVQSYTFAMSQYAQATLRDVIGGMTLDQLLAERDQISREIEQAVQKETNGWGLEVSNIKIQDIDMPEELKKMMSRQASAEREKRATITKAEGDKEAAFNLAAAATTMATSPGAMQLRTLQTIDGLGPTASNTVVLAVPIELMQAASLFVKDKKQA
ncbi:MAG: slipin family protein [Deltaproteobacteria bacterium]|nr:MAG: slipin family protein [Deltaproteobacteria bacterium]